MNLFRLGAAVHQIFVFRKYKTGCLRYETEANSNKTVIDQVHNTMFYFTCSILL